MNDVQYIYSKRDIQPQSQTKVSCCRDDRGSLALTSALEALCYAPILKPKIQRVKALDSELNKFHKRTFFFDTSQTLLISYLEENSTLYFRDKEILTSHVSNFLSSFGAAACGKTSTCNKAAIQVFLIDTLV